MHTVIRAALEKYLTDHGAAPICKSHLGPLTEAVEEAVAGEVRQQVEAWFKTQPQPLPPNQ